MGIYNIKGFPVIFQETAFLKCGIEEMLTTQLKHYLPFIYFHIKTFSNKHQWCVALI